MMIIEDRTIVSDVKKAKNLLEKAVVKLVEDDEDAWADMSSILNDVEEWWEKYSGRLNPDDE